MHGTESTLATHLVEQMAERIEARLGLSYPPEKRRDLMLAIRRMTESMGLRHESECADWLLAGDWSDAKDDLCARHLTVGETYFFREPRAFDLVCDYAREKSMESGSSLRIWSAGCCTGEEPYSIAMALRHAVPELDPGRISILGTDLNTGYLQHARKGAYRQWSFRSTHPALKAQHFSNEGDGLFRLNGQIREMVEFAEVNLADPAGLPDMHAVDIIFCRNVLMYFSRTQTLKVIERFRERLVDGGWLIVSPSEASAELFSGFSGVYYPDAIYFRKTGRCDHTPARESIPDAGMLRDEPERAGTKAAVAKREPKRMRPDDAKTRPSPDRNAKTGQAVAAVLARARLLANEGTVAEAKRCLEQAMESAPACADIHYARAQIAMESGDHGEAMQSLKRVVYLQPDYILAYYLMGVIQSARNMNREAARKFKTVEELLGRLKDEDIVPGSEGLSAACLLDSVQSYLQREDR